MSFFFAVPSGQSNEIIVRVKSAVFLIINAPPIYMRNVKLGYGRIVAESTIAINLLCRVELSFREALKKSFSCAKFMQKK